MRSKSAATTPSQVTTLLLSCMTCTLPSHPFTHTHSHLSAVVFAWPWPVVPRRWHEPLTGSESGSAFLLLVELLLDEAAGSVVSGPRRNDLFVCGGVKRMGKWGIERGGGDMHM